MKIKQSSCLQKLETKALLSSRISSIFKERLKSFSKLNINLPTYGFSHLTLARMMFTSCTRESHGFWTGQTLNIFLFTFVYKPHTDTSTIPNLYYMVGNAYFIPFVHLHFHGPADLVFVCSRLGPYAHRPNWGLKRGDDRSISILNVIGILTFMSWGRFHLYLI